MLITRHVMEAAPMLKKGGIGIIPADTIYGIMTSAFYPKSIERIYHIKRRNTSKPLLVLISSQEDLDLFGISIKEDLVSQFLNTHWPGPFTCILQLHSEEHISRFNSIHRETNSIAFRVPDNQNLCDFLKKSGPLVAPSANPEGFAPANNISQARQYFGDKVDVYVDIGEKQGNPSQLWDLTVSPFRRLR